MADRRRGPRALIAALLVPLALAGCGAERVWAPEDAVRRAIVPNPGPTQLTLVTVVSTRNGTGAHSGLLIDASQRALFDPAGTFKLDSMPERNDVMYGVTDVRKDIYIDYHARVTYDVVTQTIPVSPEVAELVLRRVEANGAVPKAMCASSISSILQDIPGFGSIRQTFSPVKLEEQFGQLPGVTRRVIHDDDADDNRYVLYTHDGVLDQ